MYIRFLKSCLMVLLLIFINNISFSQTKDTVITFNPVEITAEKLLKEKIFVKISLDSTVLKNYYSNSLSEALNDNSSVFVKTYGQGSLATVSMRGTAASHTQVEWNGININSPMIGQVDFSQIPIWFIDQVEVLPGSSSLQNGSGAIGGNVNISSLPTFNRRLYGSFVQSIGSFGTYQSFIQLGGGSSNFQVKIRAYNEISKNNFEYFNNANGLWNYEKQKNAAYSKQGLLSELFVNGKKNSFAFALWFHQSNRELPAIMSYQGIGRVENQFDKDIRLSVKWKKFFHIGFSELTTGFSLGKLDYYLANETNLGTYINYNTSSNSGSGFVKHNLELTFTKKLFFKWVNNFDYYNAVYTDKKSELGFNAFRLSAGSGASIFYQFNKKVSSYLLVRSEFVDKKFLPIIPSIGFEISKFMFNNLSLKSNFSRNYHQPTLNDLYWNPGGNPSLKPEEGFSGDLGLYYSFFHDSLFSCNASATAYASLIKNWIIWQPSEYQYWTATNMNEVFARGVESKVDLLMKINKWKFQLILNYSFSRTANKEINEDGSFSYKNQLIYIPIHKGNSMINVIYKSLSVNYSTNYTGERHTNSISEEIQCILPAYVLHNIGLSKSFKYNNLKFDIETKVNNVLNTDYQAILWRAMPKRNAQINVKISF